MNFLYKEYPLSDNTFSNIYKEQQYAYGCLVDCFVFLGGKHIEDPMVVSPFFKFRKVKKDTMIMSDKAIADRLFYIAKGAVKNTVMIQGQEQILLLLTEGNFITSFTSFFDQTISRTNTTTTEDSILLEISHEDFKQLQTQISGGLQVAVNNALTRFLHLLTEISIIQKVESAYRYEYLISKMPQIPNRFQLKHQASFLGMKPETLSRIRNTISQR